MTGWRPLHLGSGGTLSEQRGEDGQVTFDLRRNAVHQPERSFRVLQSMHDGEQVEVLIRLSSSATLFRGR